MSGHSYLARSPDTFKGLLVLVKDLDLGQFGCDAIIGHCHDGVLCCSGFLALFASAAFVGLRDLELDLGRLLVLPAHLAVAGHLLADCTGNVLHSFNLLAEAVGVEHLAQGFVGALVALLSLERMLMGSGGSLLDLLDAVAQVLGVESLAKLFVLAALLAAVLSRGLRGGSVE